MIIYSPPEPTPYWRDPIFETDQSAVPYLSGKPFSAHTAPQQYHEEQETL